jgi:hypothetical protein
MAGLPLRPNPATQAQSGDSGSVIVAGWGCHHRHGLPSARGNGKAGSDLTRMICLHGVAPWPQSRWHGRARPHANHPIAPSLSSSLLIWAPRSVCSRTFSFRFGSHGPRLRPSNNPDLNRARWPRRGQAGARAKLNVAWRGHATEATARKKQV